MGSDRGNGRARKGHERREGLQRSKKGEELVSRNSQRRERKRGDVIGKKEK